MKKIIFFLIGLQAAIGAVLPPPWANPKLNPCATQPGGWQLLYWPPDGKCYKIFKTGHPCPSDMELSPSTNKSKFSAECRCPPATAQSARDGKCYALYTNGPCEKNHYFAPDAKYNSSSSSKRQWGICTQMASCPHPNHVFWPRDSHCYPKHTKGPCIKGQLITQNGQGIPECVCSAKNRNLRDFLYADGNCYQHFTRGPCQEPGELFLPDRTCNCHSFLPHFHESSAKCYEIGTIGPCEPGENYQLHYETRRGICECKRGYIRHLNSSKCYRPFTEGPCGPGNILANATSCISLPCERGFLLFANIEQCFRIGTQGPCRNGQIVTFDFQTRPSLDGISYNGVCSCEKYVYSDACNENNSKVECESSEGFILYEKRCYKLYTQGACSKGEWLVPKRRKKEEIWLDAEDKRRNEGVCECMPGYTPTVSVKHLGLGEKATCAPPTVILADFLNRNFTSFARIVSV